MALRLVKKLFIRPLRRVQTLGNPANPVAVAYHCRVDLQLNTLGDRGADNNKMGLYQRPETLNCTIYMIFSKRARIAFTILLLLTRDIKPPILRLLAVQQVIELMQIPYRGYSTGCVDTFNFIFQHNHPPLTIISLNEGSFLTLCKGEQTGSIRFHATGRKITASNSIVHS